jgi:hypothetical protein
MMARVVFSRIRDADPGPRDLGGIAAEEVVHRPGGRQPTGRRQDAERVAGEDDEVPRMAAQARDERPVDVLDRVAGAGVLGDENPMVMPRLSRPGRFAGAIA